MFSVKCVQAFWVVLALQYFQSTTCLELKAYLSQHGLHGEVSFKNHDTNSVSITTNLKPTLQYPNQEWSWSIREFPVDYRDLEDRCSDQKLGKVLIQLDDLIGYLIIPDNNTIDIESTDLKLTGDNGLFGKSLLLIDPNTNKRMCASLTVTDKSIEKVAVAKFHSPIAGSIHLRWISTRDNITDTLIETDLYHVRFNGSRFIESTEHYWKIFVADIFDTNSDKSEENCNILQLVFDPSNRGNGKSVGDIDKRLGKIRVATQYDRKGFKTLYRDEGLRLLPTDLAGTQRRLFIVIYDNKHEDSYLACAKLRQVDPVNSRVIIQSGGIIGNITLIQHSPFDPTLVNVDLEPAKGDLESKLIYGSKVGGYKIHDLPPIPAKTVTVIDDTENPCATTKYVYDPNNIGEDTPPSGFGTQDQYKVGDLSGKLLGRNNATDLIPGSKQLKGLYWDVFLPLQGTHSVIHRSLVIYQNIEHPNKTTSIEPWICGNIVKYLPNFKYQMPIFTAQVVFRYPLVGRILFRQAKDDPYDDTTVLVETLVHADGSQINNTREHRWAVHELPPGKDYYNWTARCLSAGDVFNPYKVLTDEKSPSARCSLKSLGLCRLGDLSTRLGMLDIAGRKIDGTRISRRMFTDTNLPLTGFHKVVGKSFVIYDDHGPVARGERLACSIIGGVYRRKAVVRDWYGNGIPVSVKGKIEFIQQTEYDITNVEVNLQGLNENSGYHIHMTPVESQLEFPCESTTLYGHWNPLNVDPLQSPRNYRGTSDEYEMGDLSGKFGNLEGQEIVKTEYNDTMLPLFGPRSILGRSVIIHKKDRNQRWACSTIERGYSPSEARERRAIASFHHPAGFAYGYIRMTQLVYNDDSKSDTVIEVKLRHPGKHDRNVTRNHNWAVFVNPIGVDAAVKVTHTRCVAGGYLWNPFFTQLADPLNEDLYRQECGPDNPLRCYVGDISARLGTIDLGLQRQVFTDSNLPLEGDVNIMGRSIVIMAPNKGSERFACANIEPDYDIIKYANIRKPPRFVLAQFIEDVRHVMGIPEWMLHVDSRKTRTLHNGGCIQFLLHFKGLLANQLEQDFSKLLVTGRMDTPTLYIPGYVDTKRKKTLAYRQCGVTDPNEKKQKQTKNTFFFNQGTGLIMNKYIIFTLVIWQITKLIITEFK